MGSLSIWHWLILSGISPVIFGTSLSTTVLVTNPVALGPALIVALLILS